METLSVRIPKQGLDRLLRLSDQNKRRLSDQVRATLIDGLNSQDVEFDEHEFFPANAKRTNRGEEQFDESFLLG